MLLKEMFIQTINASIWFRWMKKTSSLIEDKRQATEDLHSSEPQKAHTPLVSLLLLPKMVAVCCFVCPLALRLWSGSVAVRLKFKF